VIALIKKHDNDRKTLEAEVAKVEGTATV